MLRFGTIPDSDIRFVRLDDKILSWALEPTGIGVGGDDLAPNFGDFLSFAWETGPSPDKWYVDLDLVADPEGANTGAWQLNPWTYRLTLIPPDLVPEPIDDPANPTSFDTARLEADVITDGAEFNIRKSITGSSPTEVELELNEVSGTPLEQTAALRGDRLSLWSRCSAISNKEIVIFTLFVMSTHKSQSKSPVHCRSLVLA